MKVKARTFSGTTSNEVTQREIANRALARKAATEGFVLLKNEGHFLPAPKGGKIALYGAGAVKTIKGGTGSGDVNERDHRTGNEECRIRSNYRGLAGFLCEDL